MRMRVIDQYYTIQIFMFEVRWCVAIESAKNAKFMRLDYLALYGITLFRIYTYLIITYGCPFNCRIAGIFRGGKFSRKPLQLYYSNYSRAEFSRNAPSSAKNYPFCTELTVRAALCNHTLARHLFAG